MSHKIKIAILVDVLEDIKGGAERQIYELLKRMDRGRFEPYLYILHQKDCPKEVADPGITCYSLGLKRIYDPQGIAGGFKFVSSIRREKIDVVLTYHFSSDIWGAIFGRLGGIKTIISSRRDIGFWRNKNHILAYKLINRWVKKVVVVSQAVKRMVIEEEGVATDKIAVVYNGVDLGRFGGRKGLESSGQGKVVCSVGNFNSETKGQRYLIEAMKIVAGRHPEARLVLVGDGEEKRVLELRVTSYELKDKVKFLGKRSDISEILAASDVCVLPSLSEGLSNSLIEYMAAGRPVVATAVGGNVEVIKDGVNGLLVPSKDPAALAIAILKLLDDPIFAERLGREARDTVEQDFEVNKQIGKLLEFIADECCASR